MAILDEMTNIVSPQMITGLQTDHIVAPCPTSQLLDSFMRKKTGPAGNGVSLTELIEQGDGRFYTGLDTVEARESNEGTVQHFEKWCNGQWDVVLAGTQLESVLGMRTRAVIESGKGFRDFPTPQRLTIINLAKMRYEQAAVAGKNDIARVRWGIGREGDNLDRMPINLPQVFDATANLHGIGPDDLGEFDAARHPWGKTPPNTDQSKKRHIPQIFHNNGTNRTISKSVLDGPALKMQAVVPGFWLAPTHADLFMTLSNEFTGNDQGPLLVGAYMYELGIECIKYHNTYYYVDPRAPEDEIYHIHIGMTDGRGGSYFPLWWDESESITLEGMITGKTADLPRGVPMGGQMRMPWGDMGWTRSDRHADALYTDLLAKYLDICLYRWKQYSVKDLQS